MCINLHGLIFYLTYNQRIMIRLTLSDFISCISVYLSSFIVALKFVYWSVL